MLIVMIVSIQIFALDVNVAVDDAFHVMYEQVLVFKLFFYMDAYIALPENLGFHYGCLPFKK